MEKMSNEIDVYMNAFSEELQDKMKQIRKWVHEIVPDATEKISYQMPTFYYFENLVHFAAYPKHLGFYPTPSAISAFEAAIKEHKYKYAKGSVQFPNGEPLPELLIKEMIHYRKSEVEQKQAKGAACV